ncbi:MAG: carboxypeptidase regulatory-like domain-containing protein [Anaerolineae bacterium]|nr:carboxypeptidase regulatory-like domain-containing protein [Anaerolineae bacterium]
MFKPGMKFGRALTAVALGGILIAILFLLSTHTDLNAQTTGAISGHVYQADGTTPIGNIHVYAEVYDTGEWKAGVETTPDGSYTLSGLDAGDYRIAICPSCTGQHYVREYYPERDQHHLAGRVAVVAPDTTSGIDFTLDPAGVVTGRVTAEGGAPVADLHIAAIRRSDDAWFGGPNTDSAGYYTFTEVPATDIYIYACSRCNNHPYIGEYYDDTPDKSSATALSISAGVTTTHIDFALAAGGAISGHVHAADGITPLAGVNVGAESFDGGDDHHGVQTAADGSYLIRGLASGAYRVNARLSGYAQEFFTETLFHHYASPVVVTAPQITTGIDFTLEQGGVVTGWVKTGGGSPIANLHIAAIRVSDGEWHGGPNTDDLGRYTFDSLPPGEWTIYACSSCNNQSYVDEYYDNVQTRDDATAINVTVGSTTSEINFTLAAGGQITGTVYQADGITPLADANIHLNGWDDQNWQRHTSSGPDGRYAFTGLPAGSYRVSADTAGYIQTYYPDQPCQDAADAVHVTAPGMVANIDLTLPQGDAAVRGHVRYQGGAPVAGIQVQANRMHACGHTYAHTDAAGAYTLTLPAGTWGIQIDRWARQADGHTMNAIPLLAIGSGDVETGIDIILLPHQATVAGVVRAQDGSPIDDVQVALVDEPTGWYLNREVRTDAGGAYTISVPAGTWRINAWADDHVQPPNQQFTVGVGETATKDLYLNALTSLISGQVRDQFGAPVPGAWVDAWNPKQMAGGGGVPRATADAGGTYTLSVYAGEWHLNVHRPPTHVSQPACVVVVGDAQHLGGVDLALHKATATVQGTVRLGSYGGPPIAVQADTRVDSRWNSGWIHHQTIDSTGAYTSGVTAGAWDAYAHLEGYTCKEARTFTVADGQTVHVDLVVLTNTAIISGVVIDQFGFPVPNADINIYDRNTGRDVIPWSLGWADSVGRYTVGVAAGRWRVCAWRDGYDTGTCPEIAIADGETRRLNFVLTSQVSAIEGLVTDRQLNPADNVPLEGANVQLWDAYGLAPICDQNGPLPGGTTDVDGAFDFSVQVLNGPYLVRAFREGYRYAQGLIYTQGGRHGAGTLRLPTQVGGTLSGQVTDGSAPIAHAIVVVRQGSSLLSAFTQDGALARTVADANGYYTFTVPLAPGSYTVAANAVGYALDTAPATILSGTHTVADVVLGATGAPPYGAAFLTANILPSMEENHPYPALVQVQNVGSETWVSGGQNQIQFNVEWQWAGPSAASGGESMTWLNRDIPPGETILFPLRLWTPGASVYTITWGLWQDDGWLGNTQQFTVTVTPPALPNLSVQAADISTNPPTVREGQAFEVLAYVRNDSDVDANNVEVEVRIGGHPVGVGLYTINHVPRHGAILLRIPASAPPGPGGHAIGVRVDPYNTINESNEGDNGANKAIQVFPAATDTVAPTGAITVNLGALTTVSRAVNIALSATDNPGGTGVQRMYVTEFVFDETAGQWQIAHESGWISPTASLPWTLSPGGGIKHIQVRWADGEWNISAAAKAWINYTPPCDGIALGEWKLYQWTAQAGERITTTLTPCGGLGDPDLYAWIGPSGGSPHGYSSNAGVAPDTIILTVAETNVINFWVYGFEATTFNLTMLPGVGSLGVTALEEGTRAQGDGKSLPEAPPSIAEAPVFVPQTPVHFDVWLPQVMRMAQP